MTQKETIKNLEKENALLREQIALKEELEKKSEIDFSDVTNFDTSGCYDFKPKLEVGKWYKFNRGLSNFLYFIENIKEGTGYGFNKGIWCNDNDRWCDNFDNHTPATDKEVEEALIKEAKKRGFKVGVKVYFKSSGEHRKITGELYISRKYKGEMVCFGSENQCGDIIFQNGKWVEIIEESVPTIEGCKMEVRKGNVRFGCVEISISKIEDLHCELKTFNDQQHLITSFVIDGYKITMEQLNEIVDYLNK